MLWLTGSPVPLTFSPDESGVGAQWLDAAAGQALANQVKLIERAIANCHCTRPGIGIGINPHRQAQEFLKMRLHRGNISRAGRIPFGPGAALGRGPILAPDKPLDVADRKLTRDGLISQLGSIFHSDQRAGMTHR